MPAPGEYIPDVTEGITRVEDLPKTQVERRSRNFPARRCLRCGCRAGRYAVASRTLHDLGNPRSGHPVDLLVRSRAGCPRPTFQGTWSLVASPSRCYPIPSAFGVDAR